MARTADRTILRYVLSGLLVHHYSVQDGGNVRAYEALTPITLREDRFADPQIPIAYSGD